jgi:catechol 2,3-dioxygenase-like lactoylglutathione lyase family enzyme
LTARYAADHVHLRSLDPAEAAAFYVTMFGAERREPARPGGKLREIVVLGGLTIFIEQVPPGTAAAPPPPYLGVEHIGLSVTGFDAAVAELEANGATFAVPPQTPRPGVRIAFVQAPDGVRVEILERS